MLSKTYLLLFILFLITGFAAQAQQVFTLKEAVETAVENYGTLKAKNKYAEASVASVEQARRDYLPNLNLGAQQVYGTVNGQIGPLYGFGGLGVASSGLPSDQQNWDATFGALYLTNVNWEFFAFGRAKGKIRAAQAVAERDYRDWEQEVFQHKIKVAGAYLNLLAAHQLTRSYEENLERANTFREIVASRAFNGLIAGVDSSQANAEYSSAKIALTNAKDFEQERSIQLAQLMGIPPQIFELDTFFVSRIPDILRDQDTVSANFHPLLRWYESRISLSEQQTRYFKTFYYPAFTLVGILQTRASGFGNTFASDRTDFSNEYWPSIQPTRTNYLVGIGVTWNLTQPLRISQQVRSQSLISEGLEEEYKLANQQINAQLQLAESKLEYALDNYREAPIQVKAASDAYLQQSVLYENGLTDLTSVTQASYALIRAETDKDIAYNNVWQALLLKAAAVGDFSLFEDQL